MNKIKDSYRPLAIRADTSLQLGRRYQLSARQRQAIRVLFGFNVEALVECIDTGLKEGVTAATEPTKLADGSWVLKGGWIYQAKRDPAFTDCARGTNYRVARIGVAELAAIDHGETDMETVMQEYTERFGPRVNGGISVPREETKSKKSTPIKVNLDMIV